MQCASILRAPLLRSVRLLSSSHVLRPSFGTYAGRFLLHSVAKPQISISISTRESFILLNRRWNHAQTIPHEQIKEEASEKYQEEKPAEEKTSNRAVGWWLVACSGMVFAMVVLGGVTRLTKSGLSMSYWKPTAVLPPITQEEWEAEFELYKQFPEYQKRNMGMSLEEFKMIFYMEWLHRVWGRAIGVVFLVPMVYFVARRRLDSKMIKTLSGVFLLGGAQGALGWYMVKSGLSLAHSEEPRVSPYRLCAHLLAAFSIYSILVWNSLSLLRKHPVFDTSCFETLNRIVRIRRLALLTTGIISITVVSGAFMAGNEAGVAYPEWPTMSGQFIPDGFWREDMGWRNLFENIPMVHFDHRMLAYTAALSVGLLWLSTRRGKSVNLILPPQTRGAASALGLATIAQAGLGITTVLMSVPIHAAATHQAGSLILLTIAIYLLHTLRLSASAVSRRIATKVAGKL